MQVFAFPGVLGGEPGRNSVQIEIPYRFPCVRRFLRLLQRLLEFFFQQLRGMLLRFHRLAEDRVAPAVLLLHGSRRFFHVVEGFRFDRRGVRDDAASCCINLHDRAAARASHVKTGLTKLGFALHNAIIPHSASLRRRDPNRQHVEKIQHLPTQQYDRHQNHENCQHLAKTQAGFLLLEAPRTKAQNVQCGKTKHQRPKNVVNLFARGSHQDYRRKYANCHRVKTAERNLRPPADRSHCKQERCVNSSSSKAFRRFHAEFRWYSVSLSKVSQPTFKKHPGGNQVAFPRTVAEDSTRESGENQTARNRNREPIK